MARIILYVAFLLFCLSLVGFSYVYWLSLTVQPNWQLTDPKNPSVRLDPVRGGFDVTPVQGSGLPATERELAQFRNDFTGLVRGAWVGLASRLCLFLAVVLAILGRLLGP
jgi:hypothetical protein